MNDFENVSDSDKRIIVCDLGELDWVEFVDGTVLIDYRYISELQKKMRINSPYYPFLFDHAEQLVFLKFLTINRFVQLNPV